MVKLVLLVVGLIGGAGGAVSWLLGRPASQEPVAMESSPFEAGRSVVSTSIDELKVRAGAALAVGRQEGKETESRLRAQFDSSRRMARRTGRSG